MQTIVEQLRSKIQASQEHWYWYVALFGVLEILNLTFTPSWAPTWVTGIISVFIFVISVYYIGVLGRCIRQRLVDTTESHRTEVVGQVAELEKHLQEFEERITESYRNYSHELMGELQQTIVASKDELNDQINRGHQGVVEQLQSVSADFGREIGRVSQVTQASHANLTKKLETTFSNITTLNQKFDEGLSKVDGVQEESRSAQRDTQALINKLQDSISTFHNEAVSLTHLVFMTNTVTKANQAQGINKKERLDDGYRIEEIHDRDNGITVINTYRDLLVTSEMTEAGRLVYNANFDRHGAMTSSKNFDKSGGVLTEMSYYPNGAVKERREQVIRDGKPTYVTTRFDKQGKRVNSGR